MSGLSPARALVVRRSAGGRSRSRRLTSIPGRISSSTTTAFTAWGIAAARRIATVPPQSWPTSEKRSSPRSLRSLPRRCARSLFLKPDMLSAALPSPGRVTGSGVRPLRRRTGSRPCQCVSVTGHPCRSTTGQPFDEGRIVPSSPPSRRPQALRWGPHKHVTSVGGVRIDGWMRHATCWRRNDSRRSGGLRV
jgi:hypothetical protein